MKPLIKAVRRSEDLVLHYPGQNEPQKVLMWINWGKRTVEIRPDPEIGGAMPEEVWNGRVGRFRVWVSKRNEANALMRAALPLVTKICDGYSVDWNGSCHVGRFTEAAQDAMVELAALTERARGF